MGRHVSPLQEGQEEPPETDRPPDPPTAERTCSNFLNSSPKYSVQNELYLWHSLTPSFSCCCICQLAAATTVYVRSWCLCLHRSQISVHTSSLTRLHKWLFELLHHRRTFTVNRCYWWIKTSGIKAGSQSDFHCHSRVSLQRGHYSCRLSLCYKSKGTQALRWQHAGGPCVCYCTAMLTYVRF